MTVLRLPGVPVLPESGWLYDDAAVFGLLSPDSAVVPRLDGWSAADVAARVAAKADAGCGGLDDDGWWSVAELAAGCETLAELRPGRAAAVVCVQTFACAWDLSRQLPCPPRSLRTLPSSSLARELRYPPYGLAAAELRDAARRLTTALADDDWTDGDTLAGWVHDAMFGLALCRRALRDELDPAPVPPAGLTPGDRRRLRGTGRTVPAASRGGGGPRAEATAQAVARPCPRARAPVARVRDSRPRPPGPYAA
jgi:hypothetical protein